MPALLVLTASAAWLLLAAGVMKIAQPAGTAPAVRALTGTNVRTPSIRALGVAELLVASSFLVWPTPITSAAIAVSYLVISGAALRLRSSDADCGCFGADSTAVTASHVYITALLAVGALALAATAAETPQSGAHYLLAASAPVALGWYALIVPLPRLRHRLDQLAQ